MIFITSDWLVNIWIVFWFYWWMKSKRKVWEILNFVLRYFVYIIGLKNLYLFLFLKISLIIIYSQVGYAELMSEFGKLNQILIWCEKLWFFIWFRKLNLVCFDFLSTNQSRIISKNFDWIIRSSTFLLSQLSIFCEIDQLIQN
jgi:hypothetical protein